MENLMSIQSLDALFTKVADLLGVGLDMVKANGMEYVMMYGRYYFWSSLSGDLLWILSMVLLVSVLVGVLVWTIFDFDCRLDFKKKHILPLALFPIGLTLLITLISSLPYIMSPQMYSIEKVLQLLK